MADMPPLSGNLDDEYGGKVLEYVQPHEHVVLCPDPFLDCPVVAFNFWDVLIAGDHVDECPHVGQFASHQFELVVGHDDGHFKTTGRINTENDTKVF